MKTLKLRFFIQGENVNRVEDFEVSIPGRLIIGRRKSDSYQSLALNHDHAVDKEHAMVVVDQEGRVFVEDLSSTNGTFVQNYRIQEFPLDYGSQIKVGMTLITVEFNTNSPRSNEINRPGVSLSKSQAEYQIEALDSYEDSLLFDNLEETNRDLISDSQDFNPRRGYLSGSSNIHTTQTAEERPSFFKKMLESKNILAIGCVFAAMFGAFSTFPITFNDSLTEILGNMICSNSFDKIRENSANYYLCNDVTVPQMAFPASLVLIFVVFWALIWLLAIVLSGKDGPDRFFSFFLGKAIFLTPVFFVVMGATTITLGVMSHGSGRNTSQNEVTKKRNLRKKSKASQEISEIVDKEMCTNSRIMSCYSKTKNFGDVNGKLVGILASSESFENVWFEGRVFTDTEDCLVSLLEGQKIKGFSGKSFEVNCIWRGSIYDGTAMIHLNISSFER